MPAVRLVLASRSPQRRVILEQLGIPFEVVTPDVEEVTAGGPRELVVENARRKALAVQERVGDGRAVLGVDTAVALGSRVYGKPRDAREARRFLEQLSGRAHEVWSGIALLGPDADLQVGAAVTEVRFRRLEPADLDWALESGEWRDRAGGYAIQGRGAGLVEGIAGDYSNVVGLPVAELVRLEPRLLKTY